MVVPHMCVMFISFFPKTVCLKKFALCILYVPFGEYKEKLNFWKLMCSVCLVGSNYYGGISLVAFFFFFFQLSAVLENKNKFKMRF